MFVGCSVRVFYTLALKSLSVVPVSVGAHLDSISSQPMSRKRLLLVVLTACVCDSLLISSRRATRCSPASMAQGFGAPSAKRKGLTEKGQWKTYQALVLKGEPTVSVMVRIPDKKDAKWYGVGRVTAGGEGTIAQAVEHQKRLIMEHARRVHAPLKGFKGAFDIGLQADPELEPFVHTNERVEVPPTLIAGSRLRVETSGAQRLGPTRPPPRPARARSSSGRPPASASLGQLDAMHMRMHVHTAGSWEFPTLGSRACLTPCRGCT